MKSTITQLIYEEMHLSGTSEIKNIETGLYVSLGYILKESSRK